MVTNFALLCVLLCVLYQIGIAVGSRRSATVACIWFSTLFAFGQFVGIGNYNYICPYTHEVTHGLVALPPRVALVLCAHSNKARYAFGRAALPLVMLSRPKPRSFRPARLGLVVHLSVTIAIGIVCRRDPADSYGFPPRFVPRRSCLTLIIAAGECHVPGTPGGSSRSWVVIFTRHSSEAPEFSVVHSYMT